VAEGPSSELATSCSDAEQHYESQRIGQGINLAGLQRLVSRVPVGERTISANTSIGQGDQTDGAAEIKFFIHESVEDTKLSTNKQHTLSRVPDGERTTFTNTSAPY
jgi:hypothetical protein